MSYTQTGKFVLTRAVWTILLYTLTACEKIDLNGPERVKVKLVHAYTSEPVSGVTLLLRELSIPGFLSPSNQHTLFEEKTNQLGDVVFKYNFTRESKNHKFWVQQDYRYFNLLSPDTASNHYRFQAEDLFIGYDQIEEDQKIKAFPQGRIRFYVNQAYWDSTSSDYVVVKSPFVQDTLKPTNSELVFKVDPSAYHTFSWYLVSSGMQGNIEEKSIFVSFHHTNEPVPGFQIMP